MPKNDQDSNPIDELQKILDDAGDEITNLFGVALTIFAGASAESKDEKQKVNELARLIERG